MIRRFLSGIPFVLVSMAADPGAPAGGGGAPAAQPPEPTGNTLEEKLVSAGKIIKDFFSQLAGAMREKDEAVTKVTALTGERDGAIQARDGFKSQVDSLTTERDGLKTQVTGLTTERDTARSRVTLIESFCKGKGLNLTGIEKTNAAPEIPETGGNAEGKKLYEEWQNLKKTNPQKATAFFRKNKAALKEYADSLGD